MKVSKNGLYFSVSLTDDIQLNNLAQEISSALEISLTLSTERGTQDDFVGRFFGLELWLFIAEPKTPKKLPRYALIGEPGYDLEKDANWLDISSYVAELLAVTGKRKWTA